MHDRILGEREKAMENSYFRDQDAKLVEKLRQKAQLSEIAGALGEKLQVQNPDLLLKVTQLGISLDNAAAFFLAPLVQVAWADGKVSREAHDDVLRNARQRGIEESSPSYAQLEEWLRARPSQPLFDTALEILNYGFAVLTPAEREERVVTILRACHEVAEGSSRLARIVGLGDSLSNAESSTIEHIAQVLRGRG